MTQNDRFKKFLQNPEIREQLIMTDSQIDELSLFSETGDKLLEVIKATILGTEGADSIDSCARKINQFLKK